MSQAATPMLQDACGQACGCFDVIGPWPPGQQQLVKAETVYMTSIFRRLHLVSRQVLHFEACPNRGCRGACYKLLAGYFTAQADEPCCVDLSRSRCLEHQLASSPLLSDISQHLADKQDCKATHVPAQAFNRFLDHEFVTSHTPQTALAAPNASCASLIFALSRA